MGPHLRCHLSLLLQVTSQSLAPLSLPTLKGLTEAPQRALSRLSL